MHLKAIYLNPGSYEIIPPEAFGVARRMQIGSRLTGKHAIAARASELGLNLDGDAIVAVTRAIKAQADSADVALEDIDALLYDAADMNVEAVA
jgi:homocitrate synthase